MGRSFKTESTHYAYGLFQYNPGDTKYNVYVISTGMIDEKIVVDLIRSYGIHRGDIHEDEFDVYLSFDNNVFEPIIRFTYPLITL
jgi:hypothetical protein